MSKASVRERPIIFDGESVQAILAGTKTQTRRVIVPQPFDSVENVCPPDPASLQAPLGCAERKALPLVSQPSSESIHEPHSPPSLSQEPSIQPLVPQRWLLPILPQEPTTLQS
jgi:hypothetical protein